MAAVARRDQATGPPAPLVLFIRSRVASATWLMGLTLTKAWSQPGMVRGWTKMLLANVGGSSTLRPRPLPVAGWRTSSETASNNQDRESPNAMARAMAVIMPGAP